MQNLPFSIAPLKYLQKKITSLKLKSFMDPEFPPSNKSLYDVSSLKPYPFKYVPLIYFCRYIVHWLRPMQFMKGKPELFGSEISPNDITHGILGNSWFATALASVAKQPELIKRMFVSKKFCKQGFYRYLFLLFNRFYDGN